MLILSTEQIQDLAIQKVNTAKNPEIAIAIIRRAEKILQNRMDANGIYEDNISWSTRTKVGLIEKMEAKKLRIARFWILGHVDGPTDDMVKLYETAKTRFEVKHNLRKGSIVVAEWKVFDIGNIANVNLPWSYKK